MAANAACHHASLPLINSERAAEQMSVNAASVTWSKLNAGARKVGWASGLQASRFGPRGDNDGERIACLGK